MVTEHITKSLFSETTKKTSSVKANKEMTKAEFKTALIGFMNNVWAKTGKVILVGEPEQKEMVLVSGEKKMYWTCMVAKQHTSKNQYTPKDMKVGDEEKRRAIGVFQFGKPSITLNWGREAVDRMVYIK